LNINSDHTIEHCITNEDGTVTPISLKDLNIKKVVAHCHNELQKMGIKNAALPQQAPIDITYINNVTNR